jgi:hypothetical protein
MDAKQLLFCIATAENTVEQSIYLPSQAVHKIDRMEYKIVIGPMQSQCAHQLFVFPPNNKL